MDRGNGSTAVRQRLILQDDVLKRIEEFAGKMQRKAEEVTIELHRLEDRAQIAEMELKGALGAFRELSEHRMVEHTISEDDSSGSRFKDSTKDSAVTGVRAQSYEEDILPRYKEALSLGLASCREYMKKSNSRYPAGFAFKPGLAHGILPHIIGSEEYVHDNSCGLIDEFALDSSVDVGGLVEQRGLQSASEHFDLNEPINTNVFGYEKGPSRKEGDETLESAASEFKAMLEAALLNPYKFYDEQDTTKESEVIYHSDESHLQDQTTSVAYDAALNFSTQHLQVGPDSAAVPMRGTGAQAHNIPHDISALLSGSLFDSEEELNSSFENPFATSSAGVVQGPTSEMQDDSLPGRPQNLHDPSNLCSKESHVVEQVDALSSLDVADEYDQSGDKIPS